MTSLVQHHTAIRIHNSDINNMMTLPVRLNGLQLPLHPRQLLAILYVLVSLSVFLTLHMSVIASMTIRTTLYVWSVSCAVLLSVLSMALMWSDPVDRSLYTESYHHNVVLTETPSSESKIQTPAVPQHGNRVQQYYRLGLDYKPDPFQSAKPTNDMPTHDPSLQFCTTRSIADTATNVSVESITIVSMSIIASDTIIIDIHGLTTLEYSHGQKTAVQSARSSTSKNSQTNGLCCQSKTNFSWV
ncbi:hypothetical protein BDEG_27599 [Batrachochytrium dendrobatidis JEL423]|uniref:Transmembrane protein n=1 Tax=Batrachochytrium dendrobatidis (strain JEL423) TaxID=403673 RepID=A0A177WXX6_BATDL|nr:hypothetical protein BDEG_27599 [Batrachochytrium dendrobatidis JEL423]